MLTGTRLKNRLIAKAVTRYPFLAKIFIKAHKPLESGSIPWASVKKPLHESIVALVTTAGIHRKDQLPFNMNDKNGDPSYREIGSDVPVSELMITHDYYDHRDADKDINIVFPITRLREFSAEGIINGITKTHYSFMGHIVGPHVSTLMNVTAREVARKLAESGADCVLIVPG